MAKGIEKKFVHYGIRKEDRAMIESICELNRYGNCK